MIKTLIWKKNKKTTLDNVTLKRDKLLDEGAIKKHVDDTFLGTTVLRVNVTLESVIKISVRDSVFSLRNDSQEQFLNTTNIVYPISGDYLSQQWNLKCIDKNNDKINNF